MSDLFKGLISLVGGGVDKPSMTAGDDLEGDLDARRKKAARASVFKTEGNEAGAILTGADVSKRGTILGN